PLTTPQVSRHATDRIVTPPIQRLSTLGGLRRQAATLSSLDRAGLAFQPLALTYRQPGDRDVTWLRRLGPVPRQGRARPRWGPAAGAETLEYAHSPALGHDGVRL